MKMRAKSSSVVLALTLLLSAACTSTGNPSGPSGIADGSPTGAPAHQSEIGGAIVFNRGTPDGIAVHRLDLDTGTEQQIREVGDFMTLSPDGSRFLGAKMIPDGRIGTEIFDVDGSNHALLPIPDPTLQLGAGQWSRDGKWIVTGGWDDTDPSRGGLYTFRSADGGGLVRLTHPASPPNDYPIAYSPDGSRVLFTRELKPYDHSGPMNVFVVRKNGAGLVRLNPPGTTGGAMGYSTSWSPDGRRVAFVASKGSFWEDQRAVFVAEADGSNARRITPWNWTLGATWSPDGRWIAFDMFHSDGPRDLFLVGPDGTGRTQLTSSDDGLLSFDPAWSADSATLLFVRRTDDFGLDGSDLWTVGVDGTGLYQVTHSPAEYTGYRWLPSTG